MVMRGAFETLVSQGGLSAWCVIGRRYAAEAPSDAAAAEVEALRERLAATESAAVDASARAEKEATLLADAVARLEIKLEKANALAASAGDRATELAAALCDKQAEVNTLAAQLRDNTSNTSKVISEMQVTVSALEAQVARSNADAQNAVLSLEAERDALSADLAAALAAAAAAPVADKDEKLVSLSQSVERAEAAAEGYVREIAFLKDLNAKLEERVTADVEAVEAVVDELRESLRLAEEERLQAVEALSESVVLKKKTKNNNNNNNNNNNADDDDDDDKPESDSVEEVRDLKVKISDLQATLDNTVGDMRGVERELRRKLAAAEANAVKGERLEAGIVHSHAYSLST